MGHAHELNVWLRSSPSVFIIFEFLLSINKVFNESSPRGPSHGINQTKHGNCAIAVPFLGCSYLYMILNINVVFPLKLECVVVRKQPANIKYVLK